MDDAMSDAIALLEEVFPAGVRRCPLGWPALHAWEEGHGVVLPEPYRTFVAEIANGTDDGPPDAGGLLPVGAKPPNWAVWEAEYWMSPDPFDATAPRPFKEPFPLTEEWQWEYDYYDHSLHSSLLHQTYTHGSVLLGSDQPGQYWTLVVTGPQRGQVWWLRDGCAAPYADDTPSQQAGGDFLSWARDWHTQQGWWKTE
ncbi:SMI1/KNR4 family protein [Streptomyces sp. NRRL S-340]|uniref:SMI1/KNR4 family protein n=1 Tax=Streptomyces sp. NRRL S-340 TaxID=1463901 RepID=UPI00131D8BE6|nr:SMI1/KNR4 family protein [Streptomyces sp. NRRL S-340]